MIVRFVDITGIVDHDCLNFLCFVDISGIVDHDCLNFSVLLILVELLTMTV